MGDPYLPPGVNEGMIPGNRPEDILFEDCREEAIRECGDYLCDENECEYDAPCAWCRQMDQRAQELFDAEMDRQFDEMYGGGLEEDEPPEVYWVEDPIED